MLQVKDAREEMDLRVARGLARWNGTNLRPVTVEGRPAFKIG